jgi:hypothetical protein
VADWTFPSPTATPTTACFGNNTIQTPKTATFPSHFHDAFATPQMPGYGTPQQPLYSSSTPMQRPQSSSETLRSNYYAAMQAQTGAPDMNNLVQYANDAGPNGSFVNMPQPSPQHMTFAQCDPSQIQTPPPTRGTSVKKPQMIQTTAFGTPSTIASRRFMTPHQHVLQSNAPMHQQETPMQFPMLQISPDMQQFGNMGAMTAPVQSQAHNFWNAQPSPVGNLGQPIMLEDPFGLNATQQLPWTPNASTQQQQQSGAQVMSFETPAMDSFAVQQAHPRPTSAVPTTQRNVPHMQPSYPQTSASVDPSLLYSSPAQPSLRPSSRGMKVRPTMEEVDSKRRDSAAPSLSSSTTPTGNGRQMLRRCNTTGATRPRSSASSNASTESLNGNLGQLARSGSPLKRVGVTHLDSISEAMKPRVQRPSVVLTIDENGSARAVPQAPTSPTKDVRDRYPGLFDSDSSDGESNPSLGLASRNVSFTNTEGEERRPKAARLDTPVENLEGLSLPRPSSSASLKVAPSRAAIAAAAQLKRQGSMRRTGSLRVRQPLQRANSYNSMIDTCPMDLGDHSTNGGNSVSPDGTQVFNFTTTSTNIGNGDFSQSTVADNNMNWDLYSMSQPQAQPQQQVYQVQPQQHQHQHQRQLSQPQQQQQHQHQRQPSQQQLQQQQQQQQQQDVRIRCPCGDNQYHGQALVQCKSCTQYQHPACVNINPAFGQPPSYCCFLCQRPPSQAPMRRPSHA